MPRVILSLEKSKNDGIAQKRSCGWKVGSKNPASSLEHDVSLVGSVLDSQSRDEENAGSILDQV